MTCPNCQAEVGEGKNFCGKCGGATRIAMAPPAATIPPQRRCPECGSEVQPGKKFCGRCGSALGKDSLAKQQPTPATAPAPTPSSPHVLSATVKVQASTPSIRGPAPSPPPALTETVKVPPPSPPIEKKPCPHCGAPFRAGAKFCKKCGKSPFEAAPRAATPPPEAAQPHHVPLAPAVSRPPETAPFRPPARVRSGTLVLVIAGLSTLVVAGAAIGYLKFHKRPPSTQANIESSSPAGSANASATQQVSTAAVTPSTAPAEAQSASQTSPPTAAATPTLTPTPSSSPSLGESSPTPPAPGRTKATAQAPLPAGPPPYQQAHAKAEQALVAERYIDPPDDCALSWARRAGQQGEPDAGQFEQQVLSMMARKVQAARAARNYDQSVALLTRLAALFPDHPELQRLAIAAQAEQQEYARQLQPQRQPQPR